MARQSLRSLRRGFIPVDPRVSPSSRPRSVATSAFRESLVSRVAVRDLNPQRPARHSIQRRQDCDNNFGTATQECSTAHRRKGRKDPTLGAVAEDDRARLVTDDTRHGLALKALVMRVPASDLCERREAGTQSRCLAASGEREGAGILVASAFRGATTTGDCARQTAHLLVPRTLGLSPWACYAVCSTPSTDTADPPAWSQSRTHPSFRDGRGRSRSGPDHPGRDGAATR